MAGSVYAHRKADTPGSDRLGWETSVGEYKAKVIHNLQPWKLADFHAYCGYEFTHKRGIEADQIRITGVSSRIIWVESFRKCLIVNDLRCLLYPYIDSYNY
jgi:hypothetical protein